MHTSCLRCRENVDLACLTSVCGTEQLYTDAALVLDASPHVAVASGSDAIVLQGEKSTVLVHRVEIDDDGAAS